MTEEKLPKTGCSPRGLFKGIQAQQQKEKINKNKKKEGSKQHKQEKKRQKLQT